MAEAEGAAKKAADDAALKAEEAAEAGEVAKKETAMASEAGSSGSNPNPGSTLGLNGPDQIFSAPLPEQPSWVWLFHAEAAEWSMLYTAANGRHYAVTVTPTQWMQMDPWSMGRNLMSSVDSSSTMGSQPQALPCDMRL